MRWSRHVRARRDRPAHGAGGAGARDHGCGGRRDAERGARRRPAGGATRHRTPCPGHEATAYDLYLRGRFQLAKRGAAPAPAGDHLLRAGDRRRIRSFAPAYSGLADAQGLLPLYTNVRAGARRSPSALRNADRAIALDSTLAEAWSRARRAARTKLAVEREAERDFRRAIALNASLRAGAPGTRRAARRDGTPPRGDACAGARGAARAVRRRSSLARSAMALALSGRTAEALSTAERAVSYDSTLLVTQFMLGATRLYARQPAAAIAPLEAAVAHRPVVASPRSECSAMRTP